jgi:hypothetical protein
MEMAIIYAHYHPGWVCFSAAKISFQSWKLAVQWKEEGGIWRARHRLRLAKKLLEVDDGWTA